MPLWLREKKSREKNETVWVCVCEREGRLVCLFPFWDISPFPGEKEGRKIAPKFCPVINSVHTARSPWVEETRPNRDFYDHRKPNFQKAELLWVLPFLYDASIPTFLSSLPGFHPLPAKKTQLAEGKEREEGEVGRFLTAPKLDT